jgi:hypothetical protein
MEDLFNAGYKREDVLGALRILPVVSRLIGSVAPGCLQGNQGHYTPDTRAPANALSFRTNALLTFPQHPAMKRAVTGLKGRGETTFLCLSNSNEVYISTILEVSGWGAW